MASAGSGDSNRSMRRMLRRMRDEVNELSVVVLVMIWPTLFTKYRDSNRLKK